MSVVIKKDVISLNELFQAGGSRGFLTKYRLLLGSAGLQSVWGAGGCSALVGGQLSRIIEYYLNKLSLK